MTKFQDEIKDLIRDAWISAANAHRLYPNNKHTFSAYWNDRGKNEFEKIVVESPSTDVSVLVNQLQGLRREYSDRMKKYKEFSDTAFQNMDQKSANKWANKIEEIDWFVKDIDALLSAQSTLSDEIEGSISKGGGWVKAEDFPLFTKSKDDVWTLTEAGEGEFLAAVPYNDAKRPDDKNLWWIKHCVIDDGGLKVVGEDDNEPAGWSIEDVKHYFPIPKPPKQ